jgi:diguanylate cyclase (GGDEF)-like protein/PAS domain S-box-containing protein
VQPRSLSRKRRPHSLSQFANWGMVLPCGLEADSTLITGCRRAEQFLAKSEEQYRLLFESNPIPMWVFDRKTLRFLAVNHAAIRQYGYTEREFLATTIADIRPTDDIPALLADIEKCDYKLQRPGIWRHRRKNGSLIDVEIVAHSIEYRGVEARLVAATDITERKRAEESLSFTATLLRAESETTLEGILAVDDSDRIILANQQFGRHFDIPEEMLTSGDDRAVLRYVADMVEDPTAFVEKVQYLYQHPDEKSIDEVRLKNGKTFERYSAALLDSNGRHRGRIWYFHDITKRKQAETALRLTEQKYRTIFENAVVGIFVTTLEGRPLTVNRALARMHGYDSPEELLGAVSDAGKQLFVDPKRMAELHGAVVNGEIVREAEVEIYCKDQSKRWILANLQAERDDSGRIMFINGTTEDITARKLAEGRVQFLAYFDALTGLPNRTLVNDRLGQALANARRRNEKVAVMFLDLDRFKFINDSLGHSVGDLLLKAVAERIKGCTREEDTVSRIGGDEFVIILAGNDPSVVASRIQGVLKDIVEVNGHSLSTSCSIGISLFPEHGDDGETLIKFADQAMYCAKESGRNAFRFFSSDMNHQITQRAALEGDLRRALEREEFFLLYQPQIVTASGELAGFEALIRWQHPQLGLVSPDKFISIAESTGLILPIGEWVINAACTQARKWVDQGLLKVPMAVNVSAVQFRQTAFCEVIKRALGNSGLPPQYLELELTESLLLTNQDVMLSIVQHLKELGLSLAIDDFGTGYSSLNYLKQFHVNKLKIDRSFIREVTTNTDDAAITTAIINMAKSLNLTVIAEGVEDQSQFDFLYEHKCDEIQGYYISKPVTAAEVAERFLCGSDAPTQLMRR